jgi:SnoaL-like domain
MSAHPTTIDKMLTVWNERDLSRVRAHLETIFTTDIVFIDPTIETHGLRQFEENVRDFRSKYPQANISRTSGIDSHHNLHRYSWEIVVEGKVILVGFDVTETNGDGRILRVLGFFGHLPRLHS